MRERPRSTEANGMPKAVSLFSGAGGLDLGLEAGGWQVIAQVEMDETCGETLRLQAEGKEAPPEVVPDCIENIRPQKLLSSLGLARGELGLLAGGPPCQPFTTSGLRQGIKDARASSLFPAYFEFAKTFEPRTLLIENVDGMLSAAIRHRRLIARGKDSPPLEPEEQKGSFLKWFLEQLVLLGYSVTWGVVEAADYGVPQMRQRAILIGIHGNEPCYLPAPVFGRDGLPPYRTVRWALADVNELGPIQPLSERKREVYALIPPGGNWRDLSEELRKKTMGSAYEAEGGKSGWWRRLAWDLPAPTILGMPDHSSTALIHPDEVRCLSVNECAALQSFKGVRFAGTSRSQYQQIGNAVPVDMAKYLGEHIRRFLQGERLTQPPRPRWRQESSNRRIGTHGWVTPSDQGPRYHLHVNVRLDHIWRSVIQPPLPLFAAAD
jgi:DNA (cytosine-5)-methyltransferase 1